MCISILHEPGEDQYGYERPEERWLPIHTVETIMMSVISMLADPNDESPANIDAAVSHNANCIMVLKFMVTEYFSNAHSSELMVQSSKPTVMILEFA